MKARGGGITPLVLNVGAIWNWRNWTQIFLYDCMEEMVRLTHRLMYPPPPKKSLRHLMNGRIFGPQSLSGSCGEENKINYRFKDLSLVADRVRLLDRRLGWIPLNLDRISKLISSSSLWSPFAGTAHWVSFKVRLLLLESGLIFPWHWTHCSWYCGFS
jgi:hypothetical protein